MRSMCLPAANATVQAWTQGFGLQPMPENDLDAACTGMRPLIFPGTQVLHKQLLPPLPPEQGAPMTPWAGEPAGPLTDGQNPVDLASQPQQALDAEAVTSSLPDSEAKAAASAAATVVGPASDMVLPVQTQQKTAHMSPTNAAAVGAAMQNSVVEVHCSCPAMNASRPCDMQVPNPRMSFV